jgi:hypothetical protein
MKRLFAALLCTSLICTALPEEATAKDEVPAQLQTQLSQLQKNCDKETKKDQTGRKYEVVSGKQIYSRLLPPPPTPCRDRINCETRIYSFVLKSSEKKIKVSLPINTNTVESPNYYADFYKNPPVKPNNYYAICAAINPNAKDTFSGKINTLVQLKGD